MPVAEPVEQELGIELAEAAPHEGGTTPLRRMLAVSKAA